MINKALIFGTTDLAELLFSYLQDDTKYEVIGFVVDKNFVSSKEFCGRPVFCFEDVDKAFSKEDIGFFVCVGYTKMNVVRAEISKKIEEKGYKIFSYYHPSALIQSSNLGQGTIVFPNVIIDKFVSIGDGNIFYPGSLLSHHSSVGNYNFFAVKSCVCGHVKISNNCFIGANSTIRNGVNIDDFSLIGAGSYIKKDTEAYGVYVPSTSVKLEDKKSIECSLS